MMTISTILLTLSLIFAPAEVSPELTAVAFPTYGYRSADGKTWTLYIHGWIYKDERTSKKRNFAVGLFRRSLGIDKNGPESKLLKDRAMLFMADSEDDVKVEIKIGSQVFPAGETAENGHFQATLTMPPKTVAALLDKKPADGWIPYTILAGGTEIKNGLGKVKPLGPEGLSVISDIDDTIKITNILDRRKTMENTFLRDYQAVAGMPELYRKLSGQGVQFHYVSGSPWQLYGPLSDFFTTAGFPAGFWAMKSFNWSPTVAFHLFGSPEKIKIPAIEQILTDFPNRKFILIGDNTEKDPEIYAQIARKHPHQILKIYIRNVRGDLRQDDRYIKAFKDLPPKSWCLFTNPQDIQPPK